MLSRQAIPRRARLAGLLLLSAVVAAVLRLHGGTTFLLAAKAALPAAPPASAYMLFIKENSAEIRAASVEAEDNFMSVAALMWKEVTEEAKEELKARVDEAKEAYEKDKEGFVAVGGVLPKKVKKDKVAGMPSLTRTGLVKDPNKPKKPMGTFFRFLRDNRDAIKAEGYTSVQEVAREAGRRWATTSAADKAKYQKEVDDEMVAYSKKMADYVPPSGDGWSVTASGRLKLKASATKNKPKRPPSAFFRFLSENRKAIQKQLGVKAVSVVAAEAGQQWNALDPKEKQRYVEEYEAAKAEYDEAMASYRLSGTGLRSDLTVTPTGLVKPKKDPNAPKRPMTSYMLWLQEVRSDIAAQGYSTPELMREAGRRWNSMAAADKKPYEDKYAALREEFVAKMAAYKAGEAAPAPKEAPVRKVVKKGGPTKKVVRKVVRRVKKA